VLDPAAVRLRFGDAEGTPALAVVKQLMKEGLITVPAGPEVIRLLPPLNVNTTEVTKALEILTKVLG